MMGWKDGLNLSGFPHYGSVVLDLTSAWLCNLFHSGFAEWNFGQ